MGGGPRHCDELKAEMDYLQKGLDPQEQSLLARIKLCLPVPSAARPMSHDHLKSFNTAIDAATVGITFAMKEQQDPVLLATRLVAGKPTPIDEAIQEGAETLRRLVLYNPVFSIYL